MKKLETIDCSSNAISLCGLKVRQGYDDLRLAVNYMLYGEFRPKGSYFPVKAHRKISPTKAKKIGRELLRALNMNGLQGIPLPSAPHKLIVVTDEHRARVEDEQTELTLPESFATLNQFGFTTLVRNGVEILVKDLDLKDDVLADSKFINFLLKQNDWIQVLRKQGIVLTDIASLLSYGQSVEISWLSFWSIRRKEYVTIFKMLDNIRSITHSNIADHIQTFNKDQHTWFKLGLLTGKLSFIVDQMEEVKELTTLSIFPKNEEGSRIKATPVVIDANNGQVKLPLDYGPPISLKITVEQVSGWRVRDPINGNEYWGNTASEAVKTYEEAKQKVRRQY